MTPTLYHPGPLPPPFIVKADASENVGAICSQHHGNLPKMHSCAFFSWNFSPAKRNYDVNNHEPLAIKAAVVKWQYWLGDTEHPFFIKLNQRNLEYIKLLLGLLSDQQIDSG